jgi:hypothetical protein
MPPTVLSPSSSKLHVRSVTRGTTAPRLRRRGSTPPLVVPPPTLGEKLRDALEAILAAGLLRHRVKPGITGFAQIHLPPDTCLRSVKNKLAYDLFYIRHRSWRFDLYILLATVLKLLGCRRLYHRPPRYPTD